MHFCCLKHASVFNRNKCLTHVLLIHAFYVVFKKYYLCMHGMYIIYLYLNLYTHAKYTLFRRIQLTYDVTIITWISTNIPCTYFYHISFFLELRKTIPNDGFATKFELPA